MNALTDNILSYKDAAPGDPVKQVQQLLLDAGFDPGGVDGMAGPKTAKAVTAYQKAKGLPATGTITHDTMQALIGEPTPVPRPNARPAAPGPDVLGTDNTNVMPRPRPGPDVLGTAQGAENFSPRLREDIPVVVPEPPPSDVLNSPPPSLRKGFGTSGAQPRVNSLVEGAQREAQKLNPTARIAPGTTWDQMQRLGMQSGSRTTEGMQRGFAPVEDGGMGLHSFPKTSPYPMKTGGIPDETAGGNAGNGLPPNPDETRPWITPEMKAARVAQLQQEYGTPATQATPAQRAAANATITPKLREMERGGEPGIGLPGLAPQDDFFSAMGEMGKAVSKWFNGVAEAKP